MDNLGFVPDEVLQDNNNDSTNSTNSVREVQNNDESVSTSSWYARLFQQLKHIKELRVEPIIFLHLFSLLMTLLVSNDLELDRACRINLKFNDSTCDEIAARNVTGYFEKEEEETQQLIASIATWKFPIEYSVPVLLVLLLGSWSDVHGRKLPLMMPMIGTLAKTAGLILCTYFPQWEVKTVVLIGMVPTMLSGSYPIFVMAYLSIIVDTTEERHRTIRFGIATAISTFGNSLGILAAGRLLSDTSLGFTGIYGIVAAIQFCNILLALFLVPNTKGPRNSEKLGEEDDVLPKSNQQQSKKQKFFAIFNLLHVLQSIKAVLKSRPGNDRLKLWILIVIFFCAIAPFYGEANVLYLSLRLKFEWDAGQFGYFGMYQTLAGGVGFLSTGLLSWAFSMDDSVIGLMGCISQMTSSIMYAFATISTIYIAPLVDILNGALVISTRSLISKTIQKNEQGKIQGFLAGLDAINPPVAIAAYSALYKETLDYFPGAFFLLSAAFTILPFCAYTVFSCQRFLARNTNKRVENES